MEEASCGGGQTRGGQLWRRPAVEEASCGGGQLWRRPAVEEASCGGGQTKRPEPEAFVKNALDSVILDRY